MQAVEYDALPHGCTAWGMDRFVVILQGMPSAREVVAFPKTQGATDITTGAPVRVDSKALQELHLRKGLPTHEA